MSRPLRFVTAFAALLVLLAISPGVDAFHFPWDQGHDTCKPEVPAAPPDTCDKCNTNPSPYVAATGAYIVNSRDVFIPGRLPLEVTRTYHSRDPHNGMFGHGWNFNYGFRLIEVTDGVDEVVIVRRPDGHRDRFRREADGSYSSPVDVFDTLIRSADGSWQMRDKEGTVFGFDDAGNLISIADRNGNLLSLSYDEVGALSAVTDADGRALRIAKGANGKIASISDPAGRTIGYEYDGAGNLVAVTDPRGFVTRYTYDAKGNLTSTIDAEGNVVASASFDSNGRLTGYMEDGEVYTLTHVPGGRRVVETDSRGRTRTILYNENGNITSKSDAAGKVELFGYDADFNPARITDKNGNVTVYEYDGQGNLVKKVDAAGSVTTYTYHPALNLVTRISEAGRTTDLSYDSRGNLVEEKVTAGARTRTVSYSYDAKGQVLAIDGPRTDVNDVRAFTYDRYGNVATATDPLGRVTKSTYDIVGQLVRLETPNGVITELTYDAAGNEIVSDLNGERTLSTYNSAGLLESITFPNGQSTEYRYDRFGRLTETSSNDGTRLRLTLDARGNVLKEEAFGPAGNLTQTRSFQYDFLDRVIKEIGAGGQATTYEYDANGNRTRVTDPLGRVTRNTYDRLNRLVSVTDPAGGRTQYVYDALGHLVGVTDPLGNSTVYVVDGLGSQVSVDSPEAGLKRRTFDAAGNVLTETDARGATTRFEYNELNLLTRTVYADSAEETRAYVPGVEQEDVLASIADPSGSISWTYDAEGRVARRAQVVQGVTLALTHAYDAQGRLVQLTYPSGKVVELGYDVAGKLNSLQVDGQPLVSQATYQPFGPVSGWTWGNGIAYQRSFDLNGNLIQFPLGSVAHTNTVDAANRITATSGAASRTYGYDGLDRLVSFGSAGISQAYAYDANGNRLSFTQNGQTTAYSYDGNSSRLLSRTRGGAAESYTYDAAGNVISDGTRGFLYGARGRLEQVDTGSGATTYLYNGLGQRVGKTAAGSGALGEIYVYDDQARLVGVYAGDGSLIAETVYLHDTPVGLLTDAGTLHHIYTDQLNTPRVITDRQGTVVWRWDSDPFGAGAPDEDVDGDQARLVYNLRFPGQYFDAESGLHYNYFRDYDPTLGRYMQVDPLGLLGGLNVYLYANANPISFADPTGEHPVAIAIRAAIAAAYRAMQRAIARCAGNPVCKCNAFHAAYKIACGIGCSGCNTPSVACCAITSAQAAAAGSCVYLRSAYIASKCDIHIPTRRDHPGALEQAQRALVKCSEKVGRVCKCLS